MKFYGSLFLLSLLQGSSAFAPQTAGNKQTALSATPPSDWDIRSASATPASISKQGTQASVDAVTKTLEARLAALDRGSTASARSGASTRYESGKILDKATNIKIQGGSLKTWSFASPSLERVQVLLRTEGRPLDADVELWQGPDNTPIKMRVYVENGSKRPFNSVLAAPRGPNTVAIRNIGHMEFPIDAVVVADPIDETLDITKTSTVPRAQRTIQGGALKTYPFDASIESVQILLQTDGRPLNARIELLQGPNNNKQVIELYTEDGMDRPFFAVIDTPGSGNVVRVVNTATVEFPLTAYVEPYTIGNKAASEFEPVIGGSPN